MDRYKTARVELEGRWIFLGCTDREDLEELLARVVGLSYRQACLIMEDRGYPAGINVEFISGIWCPRHRTYSTLWQVIEELTALGWESFGESPNPERRGRYFSFRMKSQP